MMTGRPYPVRFRILTFTVLTISSLALGNEEPPNADRDHTDPVIDHDSAFDQKLDALDRRSENIYDISADFEQRKFTAMLKKPLVSSGDLKIKNDLALWDTSMPRPSTLLISPKAISVYYPEQALLEVYDMDDRLRWAAVSPAPQMSMLREQFDLTPVNAESFDKRILPTDALGVRATPRDKTMRNRLDHIDILVDNKTALVVAAIIADADGDRTELIFSKMRTNTGLKENDLTLRVPDGTKTVHPLGQPVEQDLKRSSGGE